MKKLTIFIVLAFVLVLCATPVYANGILPLPHAFYGTVTINGTAAPVSTQVSARGTGVTTGIADNPTITTVAGIYGTSNPFEHRLVVQGDIEEGAIITFYVNGVSTGQTAAWHSEGITELDLTVTIAAGGGGGGGGGAPAIVSIPGVGSIDLSPYLDASGKTTVEIVLSSTDGLLTIIIPLGTQVLDAEGNVLASIEVIILSTPPPPPGYVLVGPAYDCLPDGATFSPAITIILTYDPADIPGEVSEKDLVLAYWDGDKWVTLSTTVNTVANTATAQLTHFTPFAILAYTGLVAFVASDLSITPAEVDIGGEVTISVLVTNTGDLAGSYEVTLKIDNIVVASQEVTLDAGASEEVTFTTSKDVAGSYSVDVNGLGGSFTVKEEAAPAPAPPPPPAPPAKAPINWPLIGGIIAAVVVVGLLAFFLVRRRAH